MYICQRSLPTTSTDSLQRLAGTRQPPGDVPRVEPNEAAPLHVGNPVFEDKASDVAHVYAKDLGDLDDREKPGQIRANVR
jgi:hypothetical protein